MPEKRRDTKGRILRNGEVQRPDGKYMFRYTDLNGERKTVYSWQLVATDPVPQGKRCTGALRDMEKVILKDIDDGIHAHKAAKLTVYEMFQIMMDTKTENRRSTRNLYYSLYHNHIHDALGGKVVSAVKFSHIQKFYLNLLQVKGLKPASVLRVHTVVYQLFELAVRDDIIRKNPSADVLTTIHEMHNIDNRRHALTEEEQSRFIDYVYATGKFRRWGPLFTVMLGTGLRIGEVLGLRWCDCDFDNMVIDVNHSILYKPSESGPYEYRIEPPKTKAGFRKIPMFLEVYRALMEMKRVASKHDPESFVVDGYSGFIFLNNRGKVFTPATVFDSIRRIIAEYNQEEESLAQFERRTPCYLPQFSSHSLRHTFCTRMCENEPNIKVVQDVMGHRNIRTTMDVYNEATAKKKQETFTSLEGKIKLA